MIILTIFVAYRQLVYPRRRVAHVDSAAALWDYGIRPVGVFGAIYRADGELETSAGNIDPETMTQVGEEYTVIDLEAVVALQPDLIVSSTYAPDTDELWWVDPEAEAPLNEIALTVAISLVSGDVTVPLGRYQELVAALGADLAAPEVVAAQEAFDASCARVAAAAAAQPDLSVVAAAPWAEALYIGNPEVAPDLLYFRSLGVDLLGPVATPGFFEQLRWEEAGKYVADLILYDDRPATITPAELLAFPTWAALPAVEPDQIAAWSVQ